jgi:charged multivesicular body protein 5
VLLMLHGDSVMDRVKRIFPKPREVVHLFLVQTITSAHRHTTSAHPSGLSVSVSVPFLTSMQRIFGKSKAKPPQQPPPSLDDASKSVGERVEQLDAKIATLDKELRAYHDKMKSTPNAAARESIKKRAMLVLQKKRMYETQRDQLAGQQFNIDQANFGIESAKNTVTAVAAMKAAQTQLRQTLTSGAVKVDDVYDLADDMEEIMGELNEINEAMGQMYGTPQDIDEAELEAELDMLGSELEAELAESTKDTATPSYLQSSTNLPIQPNKLPAGSVSNQSAIAD